MPHSLKSKVKSLCYKGEITEKERDRIIHALEQEPCEDCISREEAIKIFGEVHPLDYNKQSYIANIQKLPSATPKARWIPVSERLPKENGFYLATCDGEICGENEPFTGLAEYENGKWVDDEEDYQCVLAWMPLPEPYKAESEE
jgi:hypothetical protein